MNETATEGSCSSKNESDRIGDDEDVRISELRKISYGFIMPTICLLGIVGNGLNLVVLSRRNMKGRAYIYMRAYSTASLVAISFCIPFALRVLINKEKGGWVNWFQAFYHVHLELYLGNSCLGLCVMTLVALTVERYSNVCQLARPNLHLVSSTEATFRGSISPRSTLLLLASGTFFLYLPTIFRAEMTSCSGQERLYYEQRDNRPLLQSAFYQVYQVMLELLFKIGPTLVLSVLNLRIMLAYRRACNKLRQRRQSSNASYLLAEERRLTLLLGSTSLLFLVCVSPMVFLNLTLNQNNLAHFGYQVFRALANLLEVTNYSLTFYIYCLFSEDFRSTLRRTFSPTSSSIVASSIQQQQQ